MLRIIFQLTLVSINNPIFLFLPANPIMPFFRFGSPVIPLGSAANPIVVDYSPQELATMVAVAEDKAGKAHHEIKFILKRRRELTSENNRLRANNAEITERNRELERENQRLRAQLEAPTCSFCLVVFTKYCTGRESRKKIGRKTIHCFSDYMLHFYAISRL